MIFSIISDIGLARYLFVKRKQVLLETVVYERAFPHEAPSADERIVLMYRDIFRRYPECVQVFRRLFFRMSRMMTVSDFEYGLAAAHFG